MTWREAHPRVASFVGLVLRYGVSGVASAVSHIGTTVILVELFDQPAVIATNVGFAVSVVVSYTLQRFWVYRSRRSHLQAIPLFLMAVAVAGGLNLGIVYVGTEVLGWFYLVPQTIALIVIPLVNFVLNTFVTFRKPEEERKL